MPVAPSWRSLAATLLAILAVPTSALAVAPGVATVPAVPDCVFGDAPVAGIGRACAKGKLLRVRLRDGSTVTTHGVDKVPAPGGSGHGHAHAHGHDASPTGEAAVAGAMVDGQPQGDIFDAPTTPAAMSCVDTASSYHTQVILSRPADGVDRSVELTPLLRDAVHQMGNFLDAEADRTNPGTAVRIPVACSAGLLKITNVVLPTLDAADDYGTIASDLRAQGFTDPLAKYVVYHDGSVGEGIGGQSGVDADDVPGVENRNNVGGSISVGYTYYLDGTPQPGILLHEFAHGMGAVAPTSPNASGGFHCNDGWDVLCYPDGGATAAFTYGNCLGYQAFDCRGDDYFNALPNPGSFLDTHWNLADARNRFLTFAEEAGPGFYDVLACTTVAGGAHGSWVTSNPTATKISATRLCPWNQDPARGMALKNKLNVGTIANGTTASMTFTAPTGTTLDQVMVDAQIDRRGGYRWEIGFRSNLAFVFGCASGTSLCEYPGGPGGNTVALNGATSIKAVLTCKDTRGCISSSSGVAPFTRARINVYGAAVRVIDKVLPKLTLTGGTALAAGPISGSAATVTFNATDNTGIRYTRMYVDSAPAQTLRRVCIWSNKVPCTNITGGVHTLDTTRYTNGVHSLMVKARDAAGNPVQVTRSITISNP